MSNLNFTSTYVKAPLQYLIIAVATFLALQSLVVVMHEFTHSTVAWMLGYIQSPLDIVWGNPIMMTGWDEGVHYKKYFSDGHVAAEAAIGASPLAVHSAIVLLGMVLMTRRRGPGNKWFFHLLYWFVIANFMELIAYVTMRAFAANGDVGHFNHGLNLSPWFLFIMGNLAVAAGVYVLFARILPRMYAVFAKGNQPGQWMILIMTGFTLFVWGSGLRVVLYVHPDPQWMLGLSGFVAFGIVMVVCRPKAGAHSDLNSISVRA